MMKLIARMVCGTLLLAAASAAVAQPGIEVQARSEQTARIAGRQLRYTAEVGLVPVASKPGQADATAGYISYLHAGPADRPVLFVFNGGPGAASAYLQMGALGPMRAAVPQDPAAPLPAEAAVTANSAWLLDIADLVFLDPPGTGFSSIAAGADRSFYQSVAGDADAVAQAARAWLVAHGRTGAPLYILGESYGTIRAAAMVDALHTLDPSLTLRGVLLLGQALNMIETSQRPDNVVTYPIALPTLAAIACYHHVPAAPCDPGERAHEASAFGPTYLDALFRGSVLAPDARAAIAAKLEALTGISSAYYLAHDLRISKEQFRVELLRGAGRVLGRYDARYTAPRAANAGDTVGARCVLGRVRALWQGRDRPVGADRRARCRPVQGDRALRRGTGLMARGDSPFNDWPFMARLEQAMAANPGLRLFVGTGLYDLTTTVGAADYLFAQSSLTPDRFRNERYPAGHVAYSDDASWRKLVADIRQFLRPEGAR